MKTPDHLLGDTKEGDEGKISNRERENGTYLKNGK